MFFVFSLSCVLFHFKYAYFRSKPVFIFVNRLSFWCFLFTLVALPYFSYALFMKGALFDFFAAVSDLLHEFLTDIPFKDTLMTPWGGAYGYT